MSTVMYQYVNQSIRVSILIIQFRFIRGHMVSPCAENMKLYTKNKNINGYIFRLYFKVFFRSEDSSGMEKALK
jgi:hypothetical protein